MKKRHKKDNSREQSKKGLSWIREIYLTTSLSFIIGLILILQVGKLSIVPNIQYLGQVLIITSSLMAVATSAGQFNNEQRVRKMNQLLFWSGVILLIIILGALLL